MLRHYHFPPVTDEWGTPINVDDVTATLIVKPDDGDAFEFPVDIATGRETKVDHDALEARLEGRAIVSFQFRLDMGETVYQTPIHQWKAA